MSYKWKEMMIFKGKLKKTFQGTTLLHHSRYQRNLRINNITFQVYFLAVYVASIIFLLMPIIENVVNMINGSDHWERILMHQVYFPFDHEPLPGYISAYLISIFLSIISNNFITANEIFFDTLLVNLSMEFDNLGDEFENFDYKHGTKDDFKKLVDRHNILLDLSGEMDSLFNLPIMITFLGSTILLCFSLLQFFVHEFVLANLVNLIKFGAYLNALIIQIFLLCYFCQKLRTSSENVGRKIIRSNWHESSDKTMVKNLQLVLLKSQNPVELTALSFFGIDLKVFTNTMSTAYSYFSLLSTSYNPNRQRDRF
ncbi:putative odorant receptor 92a [Chironomus tepperi]|uniref:putative odorant receptor 92a n=1 Tax=Chironomus tepperi TaxID=113505 RepID=UPI00391F2102